MVFALEYALVKECFVIVRKDGDHCLRNHRTAIKLGCHEVNGAAVLTVTRFQGATRSSSSSRAAGWLDSRGR